jgi:DnaD/phage-associated family protein
MKGGFVLREVTMSNARFSILQARAVEDKRISNAQFRTLAALGMYGDKEGWCFPKLRTLAASLGKTRQAVGQDLKHLQELGYVEIHHQKREDGGMKNSLYRLIFDPPKDDDTPRKAELAPPESLELAPPVKAELYTPESSELYALTSHINAPINAPIEVVVVPQATPNIYGVYESEVGPLTPLLAQMLDDIDSEYPQGWFEAAVREAKRCTTRVSLKYIESILKRWKAEGLTPLQKSKEGNQKFTGTIEIPMIGEVET